MCAILSLGLNDGYLPALVTRQEDYYALHMAQQVVDDFYRIKGNLRGAAPWPYELAADAFPDLQGSIRTCFVLWNRPRRRRWTAGAGSDGGEGKEGNWPRKRSSMRRC